MTIRGSFCPKFVISPENQKAILDYDKLMVARGKKEGTRHVQLLVFATLAHRVRKPFRRMAREDIVNYVAWINHRSTWSPGTKNLYRSAVKRFFKHLGMPEIVDFIQVTGNYKRDLSKSDLLTPEDITSMLKVADSPRDKAIVMCLYGGGMRRSELVMCRLKDLSFYPEGYAVLRIPTNSIARSGRAKTGSYEVTLTDAVPYLKEYLNQHVHRGDPNAPLFYIIANRNFGRPLESDSVYSIVKKLGVRAGLKKNVFVHLFRASHATNLSMDGFTDREINMSQGRVETSREVSTYIRLAGDDVRKKMLIKKGLVQDEGNGNGTGVPFTCCWNCGEKNPGKNITCYRCSMPLFVSEKDRPRFEKVSRALFVYDTLDRACKKNPKVVEYFKKIEDALKE